MEDALTSYLLGQTALTTLVGQRITWDERPQLESLPAVILTVASATVDYHHGGRSNLQRARVQADVWGASAAQVVTVKRALITAVEAMTTSNTGAVIVRAFIENDFSSAPEDTGGGSRVFRRIVEFFVWHVGQ